MICVRACFCARLQQQGSAQLLTYRVEQLVPELLRDAKACVNDADCCLVAAGTFTTFSVLHLINSQIEGDVYDWVVHTRKCEL